MATSFLPEMATPLPRSNVAQRATHIRRRNRKRSDGAVAIVRSDAAAIRALGTWSLWSLHSLEVIREVFGGD
jgi:hypothetical protein